MIIHDVDTATLPRLVAPVLADRLRAMPAIVVTGPRQVGKSTLVQQLAPGTRRYHSLDDLDVLDAATRDPEALVGGTGPVTLDEVQRAPDLLHAVKRAIDRRRTPGRFLLTGSANLLMMQKVSESLAGRASYLTLVVEAAGRLLSIEIKASARPRLADAVHLRSFRAEYGKKARPALLLHTGTTLEWLAPDILAAPWWRVL